jgi:hypothetical protein
MVVLTACAAPCWTAASGLTIVCPTVPDMAMIGSADVVVQVLGQGFTPTCVVHLDGVAQQSTVHIQSPSCNSPSSQAWRRHRAR